MKAILGLKKGMTRVFIEDKVVPVTIVDTSSCKVALRKENQVELGLLKTRKPTKAEVGKYKALSYVPKFRKVFTGNFGEEMSVGDEMKAEFFANGEKVTVVSESKGKGFQGVVKRWGFKGGQRTHGQSDRLRAPGAIGAGTDPGRIWKGLRMGGRMGSEKITLKNRNIVEVKDNYILVLGPIPGANGDLVAIFTED